MILVILWRRFRHRRHRLVVEFGPPEPKSRTYVGYNTVGASTEVVSPNRIIYRK